MITSNGKLQIKRFLARQVTDIASFISLGTGTTTPNLTDNRMAFEVVRVPVLSVSADANLDKIIFRGSFPAGSINTAYEISLWSGTPVQEGRALNVVNSSSLLTWTNGTLTSTNARAGLNAVKIDYVTSGTTNAELTGIYEDLSSYQDTDSVAVAYYATTNLSSVRVRMGTDASNYYELILPAPTANTYNIARVARSTATKTGSPNWGAITYIAVRPTATAGGGGSIFLDGIRIEKNAINTNSVLVARSVLGTPSVIDANVDSDIEYSLAVNIT